MFYTIDLVWVGPTAAETQNDLKSLLQDRDHLLHGINYKQKNNSTIKDLQAFTSVFCALRKVDFALTLIG